MNRSRLTNSKDLKLITLRVGSALGVLRVLYLGPGFTNFMGGGSGTGTNDESAL